MGKKREQPTQIEETNSDNSDSESMGDSDEEITFDAMTKEERKKHNEMLGIDDDDDEDDDEDDEDDEDGLVNVDFDFSDPKPAHFKSIRNFLRYLLLGSAKDVDFSPLADAIVNQVEVGSIVEVNGEEDAYAFLTILQLQFYKNNQSIKEILSILKKKCPEDKRKQFESFLSKKTGLLLNERMRNFPPEVMPPLYTSLGEDIKWALENAENKQAFQFEKLMIIASCYEDEEENKDGKRQKLEEDKNWLYFHFEDELIKKYAEFSFSFEVNQLGDESLSESLRQSRVVMIVPFSKYPAIVKDIEELVQQA